MSTRALAARTLLFIGDSITDAGHREDEEGLGFGYVRLIAEHFAAHEPTARILNRGMSGDRVADLVSRFQPDALGLDPDVVTLYIGINDCTFGLTPADTVSSDAFEADYRFMLDQLSATRPAVPVLMITPFITEVDEEKASHRTDLGQKLEVVHALAREFGHHLVDTQQVVERAYAVGHTPGSIAPDGVHPSVAGHRLLADAWLRVFDQVDEGEHR